MNNSKSYTFYDSVSRQIYDESNRNTFNGNVPTNSIKELESYKCCCLFTFKYTLSLKIFLGIYILMAILGLCFGMISTIIWLIIPITVVTTTLIGISQKKHRYIYPFLIITVVHLIISIFMTVFLLLYSFFSYISLKLLVAKNLNRSPTQNDMIFFIAFTISICLIITVLHLIQIHVIYGCMKYYETLVYYTQKKAIFCRKL
uniref:Vesicle transport protein n=1 Tax=Strongyloides papillosus TaxID=174720 RepID=A0A0N5BUA9_STREA